jgi:hypothetical protein
MGSARTGEIYEGFPREPEDIGLSPEIAASLREQPLEDRKRELEKLIQQRDAGKPDLRTLDGALSYLNYHAPNEDTLPRHQAVNGHFIHLMASIWSFLPDGPGKTVAIRAIGRARMECNSCIANGGQ